MKKLFLTILLLGAGFAFLTPSASAQRLNSTSYHSNTCTYHSTQARVKRPGIQPWEKSLTLSCSETFEVGGFHNDTGEYANDIKIQVKGPGINQITDINGKSFAFHRSGTYDVIVTTKNMQSHAGNACWDKATVQVNCQQPPQTPTPTPDDSHKTCDYKNTQVRVKKPGNSPWEQDLVIYSCDRQWIEVGSFHNETGVYANDTFIKVWQHLTPERKMTLKNGKGFWAKAGETYNVKAKTTNRWGETALGDACKDETTVSVRCDWKLRR